MSFGYLPWQLYILLAFVVGIGLIIYVLKLGNKLQKVLSIGILLIGIGALLSGVYKMLLQFNLKRIEELILLLALICGLPGIILIIIGSYNKVKYDPQKKKAILILYFTSLFIVIVCVGITTLAYLSK